MSFSYGHIARQQLRGPRGLLPRLITPSLAPTSSILLDWPTLSCVDYLVGLSEEEIRASVEDTLTALIG
jgi:hypothetical protein